MASEDFTKKLTEIDQKLTEIQRAFVQYFLGIENVSPEGERDLLRRRLVQVRTDARNASTAVKFRINSIWNRYNTYDQMWNKTLRQIEDGTYHRDRKRAQRKAKLREQAPAEAPKDKRPEAAAAARAHTAGILSDDQIKRIYDTYVLARRRTGESTKVSLDSLSSQLKKRAGSMVEKHKARGIEFKVVIKGGKALIKAQPKKP
jgi:hypothetical protein